jgi:lactoylglutathione lyase
MSVQPRLMHTMLHVSDMDRAVAFYRDVMGMQVTVSRENPATQHRNTFVGYGPYDTTPQIEFVAYGVGKTYDKGDAYGHVAVSTPDIEAFCDHVRAHDGVVTRDPKTVPSGSKIAFIQDPDGYEIEVIQPALPPAA